MDSVLVLQYVDVTILFGNDNTGVWLHAERSVILLSIPSWN